MHGIFSYTFIIYQKFPIKISQRWVNTLHTWILWEFLFFCKVVDLARVSFELPSIYFDLRLYVNCWKDFWRLIFLVHNGKPVKFGWTVRTLSVVLLQIYIWPTWIDRSKTNIITIFRWSALSIPEWPQLNPPPIFQLYTLFQTNMTMDNSPWMKMYLLLNMGDFPSI